MFVKDFDTFTLSLIVSVRGRGELGLTLYTILYPILYQRRTGRGYAKQTDSKHVLDTF